MCAYVCVCMVSVCSRVYMSNVFMVWRACVNVWEHARLYMPTRSIVAKRASSKCSLEHAYCRDILVV